MDPPESPPTPTLTLDATRFPLVKDLPALLQAVQTTRCGALRFPILSYRELRLQIQKRLAEQYGKDSRQYLDLMTSPVYCAGCLWEFPDSYRNSLFLGRVLQQDFGLVAGAFPGYRQIAETGMCPLCACSEGLLLYESYPPSSIQPADLEAIRRYWQAQARRWWRLAEERELSCSSCGAPLLHDQGFLANKELLCASCADRELDSALEKLRAYPHYFGDNLIRKARPYREG